MSFWSTNKYALFFYLIIIILLFVFRKKFEIHAKIIAMYRTKVGVSFMNRIGKKYSEFLKWLGYIGVGVGFSGLFVISYILIKNLVDLFITPTAQSAVVPVIPGIAIPGSPIVIPLVTGWIGLFIVVLVHEASHGLVAQAHNLKVKSSGIFFFGPLMGAFVEPDEKDLRAASDTAQYSVYAAGPFSNILLALVVMALLNFVLAPIAGAMTIDTGLPLSDVEPGLAADQAGLQKDMLITQVNGIDVKNYDDFSDAISCAKPGEELDVVADGKKHTIILGEHPEDPAKGYLGIYASQHAKTELKSQTTGAKAGFDILSWFIELFLITGILSLGIGLVNLLPIGPVDGGRMSELTLRKLKGNEKGKRWWKIISMILLLVIILNLIWPLIRHLFSV